MNSFLKEVPENYMIFLRSFGFSRKYLGFNFVVYSLFRIRNNPEYLCHITKELYPEVAAKFGTNPANVERNIRSFIEISRNSGKINFPGFDTRRPTNVEFLEKLYELSDLVF